MMLLKMPPWSYHAMRLSRVWVAEALLSFALIGKAFFVFYTCMRCFSLGSPLVFLAVL
jgi:hypothetical protein